MIVDASLAIRIPSGSVLVLGLAGPPPVAGRRLRARQFVRRLEARRHRRRGSGHDLVVIDAEQPQPALLPQREADEAAELDQLGLAEMPMHALPEGAAGIAALGDALRVSERRCRPVAPARRLR